MMKAETLLVGAALLSASTTLFGCGASGGGATTTSPDSTSSTLPSGSSTNVPSGSSTNVPSVSSTSVPIAPTTTSSSSALKIPLYVAMRMDDICVGDDSEPIQANVIDWFADHQIAFNFHVITSSWDAAHPWPTDCSDSSATWCDSPVVQSVQKAYDAGQIVGTGDDAFLSLGCHASNHNEWPAHISGQNTDFDWQDNDIAQSMAVLNAAYPDASIRAFAAPGNMANNATVAVLRSHGLDLVTTQGTVTCNPEHGEAPGWNYGMGPCGNSHGGLPPFHWDCIPPDDVYYTSEGIQKANGVYSLPCGSANSNFETVEIGLSPETTIGVGTCGCSIETEECSMIASAVENARKSNGLHWTVLIMHPQTTFGNQTYVEWLDEFLKETQALDEYDVRFVTFEQMTHLKADAQPETLII